MRRVIGSLAATVLAGLGFLAGSAIAGAGDLRVSGSDREIIVQSQSVSHALAGATAPKGLAYLTLDIAVLPIGGTPLDGFDLGATSHVEDADGFTYAPSGPANPDTQSFLGPRDIASGQPALGRLTFLVPADDQHLVFVHQATNLILRLPLDGSAPSGGPALPAQLLAGPTSKGGFEASVETFTEQSGAPAEVTVWVTNRQPTDVQAQLGTVLLAVEDGRFGYQPVSVSGSGFSDEAIFPAGSPRRGVVRFDLPKLHGSVSLVLLTSAGPIELPLTPDRPTAQFPTIGQSAANGTLTARLRGWLENSDLVGASPGSHYAVASIDIGIANAQDLTSIDVGPRYLTLLSADGKAFEASTPEGLPHPIGRTPAWAGVPAGGEVAFLVPDGTSLAGAVIQLSGAEPAIRLPVDAATPRSSAISIRIEGKSVAAGVPFAVAFDGMPGNSEDWLSVATKGSDDDKYLQSISLEGRTSGHATFKSLPAGDYELRAYYNWPTNGYRVEQRLAFTVAPGKAAAPGTLIALPRDHIEAGDPITVGWQDFPGFDGDWISIAKRGDPDDSDGNYHTLHGQTAGRTLFDPLPAGDYELRAYFNDEHIVQARVPFTISPRSFARAMLDDASQAGFTDLALIERGAFVDTISGQGDQIADGNARDYDNSNGFAPLAPDVPTRVWLAEPAAIDHVRFLLWDLAPRTYRFIIKGTADGVTWQVLADQTGNGVPGGWQQIDTGGQTFAAFSIEQAKADGDDAVLRMVEFAAYAKSSTSVALPSQPPEEAVPDWTSASRPPEVNVAVPGLGASASGSGAYYAIDGLLNSGTADAQSSSPLTITLGSPTTIDRLRITLPDAQQPAFRVEVSADGDTYSPLFESGPTPSGVLEIPTNQQTVRSVRLTPLAADPEPTLSVLEVEALASAAAPITGTASVIEAEQITAGRNLALALNGGRVVASSGDQGGDHQVFHLIDGRAWTDWRSVMSKDTPQTVVLRLGGRGPSPIDAVDVFASAYGANPRLVDLAIAVDGSGWVSLGRFALHDAPIERISFPAVKANFVRVSVVAANSDSTVAVGEIAVREADQKGVEPTIRTHWPGFSGGLDIAMAALGGRIDAAEPFSDQYDVPANLIDGDPSGNGAWADADNPEVPEVTIGFGGEGGATIAGLSFNPDGGHSNFTADKRWTSMVDIWVSETDGIGDFHWLGRYRLDQSDETQIVSFAPVRARHVRVLMLDTFGSPGAAMGEIEVLEQPGSTSITDAQPPNLLDIRYGGNVVVPAGVNRTHLIDSTSATDGWYDDSGARPIDVTFGFREGEARTFDAVGFNPRTSQPTASWARHAKILVSDHPLRDFRLVADVTIATEDTLQYFAFPPTTARYVKVVLIDNGGDPVMSLGEVSVREYKAPGALSVLARREQPIAASGDGAAAASQLAGDLSESEPNNDQSMANALPFGQSMAGSVNPLTDKDWYRIDSSGSSASAVNAKVEELPSLRSELSLYRSDGTLIGTQPLYDVGAPSASFTWALPPAPYGLEMSRAENSIVLIVDRSGSVSAVRNQIAEAAVQFAQSAFPDEEISIVPMDGESIFTDFTSDKAALIAAAQQTAQGSGGSPVYDSLIQAMDRLEQRKGAKAIVIVTDGEDSGSSMEPLFKLWDRLGKTGVRIYTVGFGEKATQTLDGLLGATGGDMLRAFSAATGGRYFYAPDGNAMHDIYSRISDDFRSESGYRLTVTPALQDGALDIASTGEAITGVSAPRQIALILDASGSMKLKLPGGQTRIDVARSTLNDLVDKLPDTSEVSLTVYGHRLPDTPHDQSCGDIETIVPFGPLKRDQMHQVIGAVRPRGETPIGRSLVTVAQSFSADPHHRYVVLITDGEESCDPNPSDPAYPPKVLGLIRQAGINLTLSIVGLAIGDEPTRTFLDQLATSTGGSYYAASDKQALADALRVAFSAGYSVSDSLGHQIAAGRVGGAPLALPEGHWHVVLDSDPQTDLGTIDIAAGKTTQIQLAKEGDRIGISSQRLAN